MSISFSTAATAAVLLVGTLHVSAQQPTSTPQRMASAARVDAPRLLPGTRPNVFGAIQGNALSSTNNALSNVSVRLRDARAGQIVQTQLTDRSGLFSFSTIDPGNYVVEIMGQDHYSVLAASQLLNVGSGQAISAIVKLPFRTQLINGLVGNTLPSAAAVTGQAASAGILATQTSGAPTCDTLRP